MTEDDILESNFYTWYAALQVQLEERVSTLQSAVSQMFDEVRYAGLGDNLASQKPFSVDLTGVQDRLPYTLTLNPGRSVESVLDQFTYEQKGLLHLMFGMSEQLRILSGASMIQWVRPLKVTLVMPPTTEELIRFSGLAQGYFYGDAIEYPAAWIGGRVIVSAVPRQ